MDVRAKAVPVGRLLAHVEVEVTAPPAGTVTVSVKRASERRDFHVRGLVGVSVYSDLWVRDFEAPFGVPFRYEAVALDAAGNVLASATSASVTMQNGSVGKLLIHDPLRPLISLELELAQGALDGGSRKSTGSLVYWDGRSVPSLVNGIRNGWSGIRFDSLTHTDDQADTFDQLFGGYDMAGGSSGVLCIRPSVGVPRIVPRTFFAAVTDPKPEAWHPERGRKQIVWGLTATEVQPPAPALIEPIVSHADWNAWLDQNFGWQGFARTFATLADANRSLIPYGWASRPARRYATWADWDAWLTDNGGWQGFNATYPTWADAMQATAPIGWASR
jgi:hypothetical protein